MRLLLDTHVLLWLLAESRRLDRDVRSAIRDVENLVAVSPVSAWEIELKRNLGKLRAPNDLVEQISRARFLRLSITVEHGIAAGRLPLHHRDPFDRMLVAQAKLEGLTIVTRDPRISLYPVDVLAA